MNMFKSNGGFTLVELIVVIAILAILAGIAVPAYSGYITKANDAAAIVELDAIATAAQAANATTGAISGITVSKDGNNWKVEITATNLDSKIDSNFVLYYGAGEAGNTTNDGITGLTLKLAGTSYANGATWSNGTWTATAANNG